MADNSEQEHNCDTDDLLIQLIVEQQKTNELLTELAELTRSAYKIFNSPLGKLAAKSGKFKM